MTLQLGGGGAITGCTSLADPVLTLDGLVVGGTGRFEDTVTIGGTVLAPNITLNATGEAVFLDNVGIGATSPNVRLVLNSSTNTLVGFQQSGTTHAYIGTSSVTNGVIVGSTIGDLNIRSENKNINLSAGGSTSIAMRIDSAGRVGLGVTPPNYGTGNNSLDIHSSAGTLAYLGLTNTTTGSSGVTNGFNLIQNGLDTLLFLRESGFMSFSTASTERMRIDSSGRVGIGAPASTTGANLHIGPVSNSVYMTIQDTTSYAEFAASAGNLYITADRANVGSKNMIFRVGGTTERMRIDSAGNVAIGTNVNSWFSGVDKLVVRNASNTGSSSCVFALQDQSGQYPFVAYNAGASGTRGLILFRVGGTGAVVGSITTDGSTTTYGPTSDYRAKENIIPLVNAIERFKKLKPYNYNFITTPDIPRDGFLAHEVEDLIPDAVVGEKDAVDEKGEPIYQGLDLTRIVPLLSAALKETLTKVEALEAKVASLRSN